MRDLEFNKSSLQRLAGLAAILGGLLIPLAFMLPGGNLETARAYFAVIEGGALGDWVEQLSSNTYREAALYLSATAMFLVLLTALVLFYLLDRSIWQKYVSLTGYIMGCTLPAFVFILRIGSEKAMLTAVKDHPEMVDSVRWNIHLQDGYFGVMHSVFVPVVLVFLGTAFLSWSLLRAGWLPKWLCYWGIIVGVLVGISGLSMVIPPAKYLLHITPLHFIWFVALGIVLLLKKGPT